MTQNIDLEALDAKANPGAFSTFDMEILVPEVEKLEAGQIYLEIGVDKGKSLSVARMVAKEDVQIYGVDLRKDPEVEGTLFFQGNSQDIAKNYTWTVDVLFIDGDHSYEGCKADINSWYPHMAEHGVMLFHDCDATSPGVVQAVHEFVEDLSHDKLHKQEVFYSPNQRCSMARIRL